MRAKKGNKKSYVDLRKARHPDQAAIMRKIADLGVCPFCQEHIEKFEVNPSLRENDSWLLTTNRWPYEHTLHHLLLIAKRHMTKPSELSPKELQHLWELIGWAEQELDINHGGIAFRFGTMEHTGASVDHLHLHLIVPDPDRPTDANVKFRIS